MSWVKLDDQLHAHPKAARAWAACDASLGLHMLAMSYSACYDTDGKIDAVFVASKLPAAGRRAKAVRALVDAGLWDVDGDGWMIHDWAIYNGDAGSREAARLAKVEAGRKGGQAKAANAAAASKASCAGLAGASDSASSEPLAPSPYPFQTATAMSGEPDRDRTVDDLETARERLKTQDVQAVFDAWLQSRTEQHGKAMTAKLDEKRRRVIRTALRDYPLEDVLDAVVGWRHSPHHRGENDRRTPYDDLALLLRDASYIEKFRDLQRDNGSRGKYADSVAGDVKWT